MMNKLAMINSYDIILENNFHITSSIIMQNVVMLSVTLLLLHCIFMLSRYAELCYTECCGASALGMLKVN